MQTFTASPSLPSEASTLDLFNMQHFKLQKINLTNCSCHLSITFLFPVLFPHRSKPRKTIFQFSKAHHSIEKKMKGKKIKWLRSLRAKYAKQICITRNENRRIILYGLILRVNDELNQGT